MIIHETGKVHPSIRLVTVCHEPGHGDAFEQRSLAPQSFQRERPIAELGEGHLLQGERAERPAGFLDELRHLRHGHIAASEAQAFERAPGRNPQRRDARSRSRLGRSRGPARACGDAGPGGPSPATRPRCRASEIARAGALARGSRYRGMTVGGIAPSAAFSGRGS